MGEIAWIVCCLALVLGMFLGARVLPPSNRNHCSNNHSDPGFESLRIVIAFLREAGLLSGPPGETTKTKGKRKR